jgi:hypothetical protein
VKIDAPLFNKRLALCSISTFILISFTMLTIKTVTKCNFMNKINYLFYKADCLQFEQRNERRIKMSRRNVKFLSWFIIIFEVLLNLCIFIKMTPNNKSILRVHLSWVIITVSRVLISANEILSVLLCADLEIRFRVLNKNIRNLRPCQTLFHIKECKKSQREKISNAMIQYSNLSTVMKIVEQHFSLFWLLSLTYLSIILLVILSYVIFDAAVPGYIFSPLIFITAIQLVTVCFVCGDVSNQVWNYFSNTLLHYLTLLYRL